MGNGSERIVVNQIASSAVRLQQRQIRLDWNPAVILRHYVILRRFAYFGTVLIIVPYRLRAGDVASVPGGRVDVFIERLQPLAIPPTCFLDNIVMARAFDDPECLRTLRGREKLLTESQRDDFVAITVQEQFRRQYPANLRERIIAVDQRRPQEGDYRSSNIAGRW